MALKDKTIPNEVTFLKLRDFLDGEEIEICGCGINEEAKFGPMPYLINEQGERITLPSRYSDYILEILGSAEDLEELKKGVTIIKNSRKTQTGGITPTFTIA